MIIVEEAHQIGLPVVTHTTSAEGLYLALQAGVDVLQHCEVTGRQPIPTETLELLVHKKVACALMPETNRSLAWERAQASQRAIPGDAREAEVMDANERALIRSGAVILLATDGGVFSRDLRSSASIEKAPHRQRRLG